MKSLFLTQPYLLSLKPDSEMYILWIQKEKTVGRVEYGHDQMLGKWVEAAEYPLIGLYVPRGEEYGETPEENEPVELWQYIARIEGLSAGEKVFYRCQASTEQTQVYDFHAAPEKGQPFRVAQMSDLQGFENCDEAAWQIGKMHPDLIFYSGDCSSFGWRADNWFDMGESWQAERSRKRAFFPSMQRQDGARLMQYCPTFICPGNHEVDDLRVDMYEDFSVPDEHWSWSIYMQMFRPLYDLSDVSLTGKRWYSADYGDMHIVSLSLVRCSWWNPYVWPGWRLTDEISEGSPQRTWLREDLAHTKQPFTWVVQHWHLLNKGSDVQPNLCQPVIDEEGKITYPTDNCSQLMDIFEQGGVNGVSYGHSHVYERYFEKNVHYIEAAYLSVCFRESNAALHPGGYMPVVEDNSRHSFMILERRKGGLYATGYYAGDEPEIFDAYQIADENGKSVSPK